MQEEGLISVLAGALQEGLKRVISRRRRRRRQQPITVQYDPAGMVLVMTDARYEAVRYEIPATGHWSGQSQIDGAAFAGICFTFGRRTELELVELADRLVLLQGNSHAQFMRLDGPGRRGIRRREIRPNPKHVGVTPQPTQPPLYRWCGGDTWLFSARVPVRPEDETREP